MRWDAHALTDRGRVRSHNEDALLARPELGLFAVADGMGGHAAGEIASRLAIERLDAELSPALPAEIDKALRQRIEQAVAAAHHEIIDCATREPDKRGMGTTLTALVLARSTPSYLIAHIGDSRAYLWRSGELRQLTTDHTWVQEQVVAGRLTPQQARAHPWSSVLTRALGVEPEELAVDGLEGTVQAGDLLLLCSDGLTAMLDDDGLRTLLAHEQPLDELARQLVDAANSRGGADNITVLLIRVAA